MCGYLYSFAVGPACTPGWIAQRPLAARHRSRARQLSWRQGPCVKQASRAEGRNPPQTACAQDVVYYFAPATPARVTISLCGSMVHSDAFDTKLYVLGDLLAAQGGPLQPLACNDDFCGYQSQITVRARAYSGSPSHARLPLCAANAGTHAVSDKASDATMRLLALARECCSPGCGIHMPASAAPDQAGGAGGCCI